MSYRCGGYRHFSGRERQVALSSPVWKLLSMPTSSQTLLTQQQIHTNRSHEATWRGYSKLSSPLCKLTVVRKIQPVGQVQPATCFSEASLGHSLTHSWDSVSACFCTVQFSHSVVSNSLQPHEPQHARPPCPSPIPGVHPKSCPLNQWCHPTISSSVVPFFSCPQSFPASGSFQLCQLFTSGGQSIGVSASTSVLPMNTQDWSH